jgi:SAM-dependent methyltransferase
VPDPAGPERTGEGGPLPLYRDRVRAGSFGRDAERYDRARPSYPRVLIDRLTADRPASVVDVGCGTGIAARLFAQRGATVLGVEQDARMAKVARTHGVAVEVSGFEDWDAAGRRFDLLVSAQAWHWVDPAVGPTKAADVVRPGGRLGLFWNLGRPPGDLRERFDHVYAEHAPGLEAYSVLLGRGEASRADAAATDLGREARWTRIEVETFPYDVTYATAQWLEQLQTHSDHQTLPPGRLQALLTDIAFEIDRNEGSFVMHYETALVSARRGAG